VITRFLAGAACAALMGLCMPVTAATTPELPGVAIQVPPSASQAVDAFYRSRNGSPLWLRAGADSSGARALIAILERAPLDGLANGPALAAQAEALIERAQNGDPAALGGADRLLSAAWVSYVASLQRSPAGMVYEDSWARPRADSPMQILDRT